MYAYSKNHYYECFVVVYSSSPFFFLILHIFGVALYFQNKPKKLKISQKYFEKLLK